MDLLWTQRSIYVFSRKRYLSLPPFIERSPHIYIHGVTLGLALEAQIHICVSFPRKGYLSLPLCIERNPPVYFKRIPGLNLKTDIHRCVILSKVKTVKSTPFHTERNPDVYVKYLLYLLWRQFHICVFLLQNRYLSLFI